MRMIDIIAEKRDGGKLDREQIHFLIDGFTNGAIPDYQMSAWAMAVFFQGMSPEEIGDLTWAMVQSGDTVDLSLIHGKKVDKHSTGGVGDTTTLALAPLVAAAGVPVAKMSGRGLGHTGGTVDKLESIPGFHIELSIDDFIRQVNEHKIAVVGQSGNLTPADKKLYALRDVTATVNSIPLIASSIMSKKIAAGADAIVLDVKIGSGAFMKTLPEAEKLARTMVDIGNRLQRNTVAVISDMSQPLGFAVGNALEVREAIDTLKGEGPADLTELVLTLGAQMLVLGEAASTIEEARTRLEKLIRNGKALQAMKQFVVSQGGDGNVILNPELLPQAKFQIPVAAEKSGYVHAIEAEEIGLSAMMLGAGRETKESAIDLSVGIVLNKKVGDSVKQGETLATLHAQKNDSDEIAQRVKAAYTILAEKAERPSLIYKVMT